MLYQLDENGTLAIVLPHGVLFRGSSEGHIRKHLIEKLNVIDTMIGLRLPIFSMARLFRLVCWCLKKNREHSDSIFYFINASNESQISKRIKASFCYKHLEIILSVHF